MSISIEVQSQSHQEIRRITDGLESLKGFAMSAPKGFLFRGIDPYGDTCFNVVQLEFLLEEIVMLGREKDEHYDLLELVRTAAQEALSARGYLRFIGDLCNTRKCANGLQLA